jgi:predicted deacylase
MTFKSKRILRPTFTTLANGDDASLVIHELVGAADGPTVGISAAVHGNENTGPQAMLELYRALASLEVRGRLLLMPVANPYAFAGNHRFARLDELDLNRQFPGNPAGTFSQQLAAAITREFLETIDVHIDLHTGTDRPTVDYVYIWNDEALSRSFGSTILYRPTSGREGTVFAGLSTTVTVGQRDIPTTVIELGGGIVDQGPYVARMAAGVLNMLRHLGMIDGAVVPPPPQTVVTGLAGIRPRNGGWLEPLAPPLGEAIAGGAPLARIVSPYTFETIEEMVSPFDRGVMVMSHLTRNLVEAGDYGFLVGDLDGAAN